VAANWALVRMTPTLVLAAAVLLCVAGVQASSHNFTDLLYKSLLFLEVSLAPRSAAPSLRRRGECCCV
jgi:hypothetical protein